ncbi:Maf family protein [Chitinasiproducens palmae]|uniref:dTTP/UTP pyrophosphatase n=1 Tax=Chitinasiproducens palmae TaxID=1770053 RepID=A0A1H2PSN3_9BURK|nr:Maf family protein [Chitinasiproducens palmae]SDV50054.1 Maf-like protein [Chitinasiproducens palmae]
MPNQPKPADAPHFVYLASQSPRRRELLDQLGVAHRLLLPDDAQAAEALEDVAPDDTPASYVIRVTLAKGFAARARRQASGLPVAPILAADTTVTLDDAILGKPADAAQATQMLTSLSGRTHRVLTGVAVFDGKSAIGPLTGSFTGRATGAVTGVVTRVATGTVSERGTHAADGTAASDPLALARAAQHAFDEGLGRAASGAAALQPPGIGWQGPALRLALSVSTVRVRVLTAEDIARYVASGEPFGKAGAYGIQGRGAEFIAELHGSYSGVMGLPLFETAAALRQSGLSF